MSQLPPDNQNKILDAEKQKEIDRKKRHAVDTLWRKAILHWKLDSNQKEMYKFATETDHQIVVIGSSRQLGKSYFLTVLAIETCLKTPNVIVKFIAPKTKDIKRIIAPLIKEITIDCPKDLKPSYKMHDNTYIFNNGSEIQLAGTDNGHAESIRGNKAHVCIIDEAGFCDDLRYIVNSILIPTTTMTGGKIIMSSTPSRSPDHDFMSFMEEAELENRFIKRTIYDNPRLTTEQIDRIADGLGGKQTTDFRREYLVEKITSEDDAVVPEFTKALQEKIVKTTPIAPFYDAYVSMDIGVKDLTVVLFAYYDFMNSRIIVQDELIMQGSKMLTDDLAAQIRIKEDALWTNPFSNEKREPFLRVADNNNLVLLNDLSIKHRIHFKPTEKDNSVAMINNMRMLIRQEQVIIDPKCKTLISHLENAIWNKARDSYARSSDKGHYDACFLPGTSIITSTGVKNIEDIKVGDLVLTHKGNFKKVLEPLSRDYSGYIYEIDIAGRMPFSSTIDHKFWVSELARTNNKYLTGQLTAKDPEWVQARDLLTNNNSKKKHALVLPIIKNKKTIEISNEMSFLYGYYIAEGSLGGNGSQIEFAGHKKEKNVIHILEEAIRTEYGYDNRGISQRSIRRHKNKEFLPRSFSKPINKDSKTDNGRKISISNSKLYKKLKLLGKSTIKKFPDWIYLLDETQAFYMLCGYLFGDGHFSSIGIKSNTVSKDIVYGVELLSLICGVSGTIGYLPRKNQGHNPQYTYSYNKEVSIAIIEKIQQLSDLAFIFKDKTLNTMSPIKHYQNINTLYKTINSKNESYYIGKVYTMEVEDDHSYMVEGVPAKNCDALKYLCRNMSHFFSKNPYPADYKYNFKPDAQIYRKEVNNQPVTETEKTVTKMINLKRRRFGRY